MKRIAVFLLALAGALWSLQCTPSKSQEVYASDLAFNVRCVGRNRHQMEQVISDFLLANGFKVLNLGRIQREHNYHELDVHIIGLDDQQRIIDVSSEPFSTDRFSLGLRSPPPTRHSRELESSLIRFAKDTLRCEVRQISYNNNDASRAQFYEKHEVQRVKNLFREAAELGKEQR